MWRFTEDSSQLQKHAKCHIHYIMQGARDTDISHEPVDHKGDGVCSEHESNETVVDLCGAVDQQESVRQIPCLVGFSSVRVWTDKVAIERREVVR